MFDFALGDTGAFVHRTVIGDEHTYAVRIGAGGMSTALGGGLARERNARGGSG
jgi:hypothetical protein